MLFGKLLVPDPHRFHDGGVDAGPGRAEQPPVLDAPPKILLKRLDPHGREDWAMLRRIGYRDREYGDILVPRDVDTFTSDLTSVPALFTWLVPKTGAHLPATLVHDGLVCSPTAPPTYVSVDGHLILRPGANRVLRDAMADGGTGFIRRWLIWSAVTAATMWEGVATGWTSPRRWWMKGAVALTALAVVVLGGIATLNLFQVADVPVLPWMDQASLLGRLGGGLAAAVVIPMLIGLLWGEFRVAGWVFGVGLAVLLHTTVVLLALTGLYEALEWLAARSRTALAALGVIALATAVAGFVLALS